MGIATPTFDDDDAFLHAGGRIRRWDEETLQLPALTEPEPTYYVRIKHRRHAYQRMIAMVLGVLVLLTLVALAVGRATQSEAPVVQRFARQAVGEVSPLADVNRSLAPSRRAAHRRTR